MRCIVLTAKGPCSEIEVTIEFKILTCCLTILNHLRGHLSSPSWDAIAAPLYRFELWKGINGELEAKGSYAGRLGYEL